MHVSPLGASSPPDDDVPAPAAAGHPGGDPRAGLSPPREDLHLPGQGQALRAPRAPAHLYVSFSGKVTDSDYARSFQKYGATGFDSHYDNLVHLRRYHKSLAEWVYACDLNTAPLHSVTFLRTSRQAENPPLLVEERRSQPGLADLSTHSDAWGSIYKAMGSRSEPSGGSLEETDSVERLVRVWQEVYVERSWSTELTVDNRVYDSGDDTRPFGSEDERRLDEQEEREEAAGPREDFGLWYRELEQMDRLLDETAISRSNLSCSTARSISVCRQTTTLSSPGCPLVPSTVVEPSPRPQDKSLYCQIRQLFLGGAAQLVKRKETPWKMKK